MTSATHDDRIEVLSVAGVAVAQPSRIISATAATGRGSVRGHRTSGSGLGTISGSGGGGAVGGATGGGGGGSGGGGHRNSVHRNSSVRSTSGGGGDRRTSSGGHGGSVRRSGSGHGRHHRTPSTTSSQRQQQNHPQQQTNHHSRQDSRRGTGSRGYTYLVPSPDDQVKVLGGTGGEPGGGGAGIHPLMQKEPKTESQKRVARIVMVLATTMLLMSLLLVGITLSMSDHIDEMATTSSPDQTTSTTFNETSQVRKMNGLSTTARPRPQTAAASRKNFTTTPKPTTLPSL